MTTKARESVEEVFRLISAGQVGHAESRCRTLLEQQPDDVNLVALLGAICLKRNRLDEAQARLEQAIMLEPAFPKPYEDLGTLCLKKGDASEAVRYFEKALQLDNRQPGAWSGLASAQRELGRDKDAAEAHRKYLELSPVARGLAKANELIEQGDLAAAEKVCDELSRQNPNNVEVLRMLARIATEDRRLVIAEGLLKRITRIAPDDARGHIDLGNFLGQSGRYPEAIDALRSATRLRPDDVQIWQRLGDYQSILGKPADALASYESALAIDRNFVPAFVGRGHMVRILGRHDDAARSYESAVSIDPGYGDAWWGLASLRNYQFADAQIDELHRQIERSKDKPDNAVFLHFALARAAEDVEDFGTAWPHYVEGNTLKRDTVEYDPVRTEVMHDSLIEVFDENLLARDAPTSGTGATPIFIVGMPRSGSTLLEQVLASHSQVDGTSELPYMGMLTEALGGARAGGKQYPEAVRDLTPQKLVALGQSYLHYSRSARPEKKPFFTDKMPANFVHVGLIHLALPNAKVIDARRHPLDTCIGNYRQLFAKGKNHSYDLFECAEYYLEYLRVMNHWDSVLPGRVLTVQYEDVVSDLKGQARRLLEYCELPWEDACLDFYKTKRAVNTASSEQVRTPIYTGAVDYWKHYESELDELKDILADVLPC